jgi:transcriptional regulator with XRE-family HTH domain
MNTEKTNSMRLMTPKEIGSMVQILREGRKWSQETLAELCKRSVRTIQRVERGDPSDIDTRRAIASSFEFEDIDFFNKPQFIPTVEQIQAEKEKLERERLTLNATLLTSGKEFGKLAEESQCDYSSASFDLPDSAAQEFAMLVDYLRDYRDSADFFSEVQKLDVYADLQMHIDELTKANISLCYAKRHTKLVCKDSTDKTPWSVTILYLIAFKKGEEPKQFMVPRAVQF